MNEGTFPGLNLGECLRALRVRNMLTRAEVAERMNANPLTVWRLETGRVVRPEIKTVGRFLQACGESWSALVGKLDSAGGVELKHELIIDAAGAAPGREQVARATEQEVRNFEQGIRSRGAGRKPLSPAKRREMAERLRNYRVVANLCEQAVRELATANRLKAMRAVECRQYARKILGRLWQNRAGPVPESGAEGPEPADERFAELESGLRRLVEQAVAGQFRLLQDRVPELFST